MMRQYELVDRVRRYNPLADEVTLNRAYVYAMKAHGAQTRASGDPYFSHPLEVAAILTDMKLDDRRLERVEPPELRQRLVERDQRLR
ncbi:MAG: bifunctional (p)ppGpp synthetase/guanosine-3',5'-bis(diphosphate) 3'-pyrophosphohydrolase, partial [Beijerinckiaceae bacterium]|nr:bifunctional (p)ppGpp synthetase/guanosine-3',5'-bis(diphosphate) 3'-pyrophosphohydrolase [Beijerinckiaceae bacterium]